MTGSITNDAAPLSKLDVNQSSGSSNPIQRTPSRTDVLRAALQDQANKIKALSETLESYSRDLSARTSSLDELCQYLVKSIDQLSKQNQLNDAQLMVNRDSLCLKKSVEDMYVKCINDQNKLFMISLNFLFSNKRNTPPVSRQAFPLEFDRSDEDVHAYRCIDTFDDIEIKRTQSMSSSSFDLVPAKRKRGSFSSESDLLEVKRYKVC